MRAILGLAALAVVLAAMPARASRMVTLCRGAACTITLSGVIEDGDDRGFLGLAAAQPRAVIVLSGPGGKVAPALAIGREIRSRGMRTVVPAGESCASSCALIWLSGAGRGLGQGARIGFHALALLQAGQGAVETHAFDGEIRRYLGGLGYAADVVNTIVNTPSAVVHWRDAVELNANGIGVDTVP